MAWVLFFDGDCGFCSKSVRKVHALDKSGEIDFAPLQGKLSADKGFTKHADKSGGTMVLLREADGEVFMKSDAWVELGKALGGIWCVLASCFGIFPKGLRDLSYDLVAKNRYLLAGKGDSCGMPEESLRARMRE
ncbi:MAG: thiol-disulfide oxidoreductase DCC family protein [Luteolibacter sp.]